MSFFNKKEDVIDIQLTQYGKHLLSRGKFKPAYYAFFDDGVLYDAAHGGITEEQNEVQTRIEETPYLKTQHVYSSRDKSVRQLTYVAAAGEVPPAGLRAEGLAAGEKTPNKYTQASAERHYSLGQPLGTSALSNNKFPAWSVTFLKGDFKTAKSHIKYHDKNIKIPQLNAENISYTTQVKVDNNNLSNQQITDNLQDSLVMYADKYPDDSYIIVDEDYILLDVKELNADIDNENFDIEIFKIEEVMTGNTVTDEILRPLSFVKEPVFIKDGILLDTAEGGLDKVDENNPTYTDTNYVGYWFDIYCDREIEEEVLCEHLPESETRGSIFTQDSFSCPEKVNTTDVVDTGTTEEEEVC